MGNYWLDQDKPTGDMALTIRLFDTLPIAAAYYEEDNSLYINVKAGNIWVAYEKDRLVKAVTEYKEPPKSDCIGFEIVRNLRGRVVSWEEWFELMREDGAYDA